MEQIIHIGKDQVIYSKVHFILKIIEISALIGIANPQMNGQKGGNCCPDQLCIKH